MFTLQVIDYPINKRKDYILREPKTGWRKVFKIPYSQLKEFTATNNFYKFDDKIRKIAEEEFERRNQCRI